MLNPKDFEPKKPGAKPRDLTPLSVAELRDYIAALAAEIGRAEAMIAQKDAHRSGVDALFGSDGK